MNCPKCGLKMKSEVVKPEDRKNYFSGLPNYDKIGFLYICDCDSCKKIGNGICSYVKVGNVWYYFYDVWTRLEYEEPNKHQPFIFR